MSEHDENLDRVPAAEPSAAPKRRRRPARPVGGKDGGTGGGAAATAHDADPAPAPSPIAAAFAGVLARAEAVPAERRPYRIGSWKGHPNYQCNSCGWASLNEEATQIHCRRHEAPPAEVVQVPLVDEHGRPLTRRA